MAFDQRDQDNISQINVTPLVDVMLVLLVIFYGKVVEVMAAVRNAGVRKLGMVTEPLRDER